MARRTLALCDDQREILFELEKIIQNIQKETEEDDKWVIQGYLSGEELLKHIQQIDLVFLDIEMKGLDGIGTGEEILKRNPGCRIIIVSGREERYRETYHIKALGFVKKPFSKEDIQEAFREYDKNEIGSQTIELYQDRQKHQIEQRKIPYIRAFNGYVECKINGKTYRKETTLKQIYEELESILFFKINNQYIVNMSRITKIDHNQVFIGNMEFSISRRKRKQFQYMYEEYDINFGRYRGVGKAYENSICDIDLYC